MRDVALMAHLNGVITALMPVQIEPVENDTMAITTGQKSTPINIIVSEPNQRY